MGSSWNERTVGKKLQINIPSCWDKAYSGWYLRPDPHGSPENTEPNLHDYRERWSSVTGDRGQHIPLGCVMLATIDLQFGLSLFQFKWFFHIRPGACKLNLSFAVRAKIIISFPQNSLETQDLQVLLFALPPCAKSSRVLGERFLLESEGVLSLVSWTRRSEEAFRENIWDGPFHC